ACAVLCLYAVSGVVHLKDNARARLDKPRGARGKNHSGLVRSDATQLPSASLVLASAITSPAYGGASLLGEGYHVMNNAPTAGLDLQRLNPLVFLEAGRNSEVEIRHGAVGRHGILLLHGQHDIG